MGHTGRKSARFEEVSAMTFFESLSMVRPDG